MSTFFLLFIVAFVFTRLPLPSTLPHYHLIVFNFFFIGGTSNNNLFCIFQSIFIFLPFIIVFIIITVLGNSF
jgi:hypothetical protein